MRQQLLWQLALLASACTCLPTTAVAQPCTAERLVGTWERVSLLRNALSVQPPDAPLFVKFGADGYRSMMEMPDDRPKSSTPPDRATAKELFALFDKVEGGQGTWTINADGSVVTRRHLVNIAPGGENSAQDRLCSRKYVAHTDPNLVGREGATQFTVSGGNLTIRGKSEGGSTFESTFRRLPKLDTVSR